jgi:hypothetical protein
MKRPAVWLCIRALLALALVANIGVARAARPHELPVDVFAVGDLAQCNPADTSEPPTASVARLVEGSSAPILMVGDLAYADGTREDFLRCFDPVWGRYKNRILPVPGNHEYHQEGLPYFYSYFGNSVPGLGRGYYATQIGAWRVIALNSSIAADAGSPQELWLKRELAAHPSRCTLAYWHHPRFSSGKHGNTAAMDALWRDLHEAGVDVVVTGHDHDYERFAPQGPQGEADTVRGVREFVVGTGGAKLRKFGDVAANSEVRNADTFGVLRLTLADGSYSWAFLPAGGAGFADRGEAACH